MTQQIIATLAVIKGMLETQTMTEGDFEAILESEGLGAGSEKEVIFADDVLGGEAQEEAAEEVVSLTDRLLGSVADADAGIEVEAALEPDEEVGFGGDAVSDAVTGDDLLVVERVRAMGYAATLREADAPEEAISRLADAGLVYLMADGEATVVAMAGATVGDVRGAGERARSEVAARRFDEKVAAVEDLARGIVSRAARLTATNHRFLYAALAPRRMPRESFRLLLDELDHRGALRAYANGDVERCAAPVEAVDAAVERMQAVEERAVRHREARERVKRGSYLEPVNGYDPRDDERPEPMAYLRGLVALLGVEGGTEAFARIVRETQAKMGLEPAARAAGNLLSFFAAVLGPEAGAPAPLVAARLACRAAEGVRLLGLGRWPAEVFARRRNARRRTVATFALLGSGDGIPPSVRLRSGSFLLLALHRALAEVETEGAPRAKVPYEEVVKICAELPFKAGYDFFGWEGKKASEARVANGQRMRAEMIERRKSGEALVVKPARQLDRERAEAKGRAGSFEPLSPEAAEQAAWGTAAAVYAASLPSLAHRVLHRIRKLTAASAAEAVETSRLKEVLGTETDPEGLKTALRELNASGAVRVYRKRGTTNVLVAPALGLDRRRLGRDLLAIVDSPRHGIRVPEGSRLEVRMNALRASSAKTAV